MFSPKNATRQLAKVSIAQVQALQYIHIWLGDSCMVWHAVWQLHGVPFSMKLRSPILMYWRARFGANTSDAGGLPSGVAAAAAAHLALQVPLELLDIAEHFSQNLVVDHRKRDVGLAQLQLVHAHRGLRALLLQEGRRVRKGSLLASMLACMPC